MDHAQRTKQKKDKTDSKLKPVGCDRSTECLSVFADFSQEERQKTEWVIQQINPNPTGHKRDIGVEPKGLNGGNVGVAEPGDIKQAGGGKPSAAKKRETHGS